MIFDGHVLLIQIYHDIVLKEQVPIPYWSVLQHSVVYIFNRKKYEKQKFYGYNRKTIFIS